MLLSFNTYRIETNGKRCQPLHGRLNTSPSIMYVVSYSCLIYYVQSRTRYVQYIVLAIVSISIISMIILSCYKFNFIIFGFHFVYPYKEGRFINLIRRVNQSPLVTPIFVNMSA